MEFFRSAAQSREHVLQLVSSALWESTKAGGIESLLCFKFLENAKNTGSYYNNSAQRYNFVSAYYKFRKEAINIRENYFE
jgi:hypothetical protein